MILRRCFVISMMIAAVVLTGWGGGVARAAPVSPSETPSPSLDRALATIRSQGYTATQTGGFNQNNDLSVIVARWSGSVDGHPQRAFLFHRGHLVGADTARPSATIRWIWSTSDVVALGYDLYHSTDPLCCPTAGAATVRYRWDETKVSSQDPVPPASWSAPVSRRAVNNTG
ncbi:LppP/LprE family lipoprotein [Frankia sp. Cppng1_Ct_nod]|uniref:LppP/LprE family lipoprotein n=1 Tax=Frankia sp. Cppng1_Ct_nod TaxID=2897162 RepID=UPI001040EBEC|nr:LppP/LprE family lipoprotein [Frankia sp. Cppng1_Ct_nod]